MALHTSYIIIMILRKQFRSFFFALKVLGTTIQKSSNFFFFIATTVASNIDEKKKFQPVVETIEIGEKYSPPSSPSSPTTHLLYDSTNQEIGISSWKTPMRYRHWKLKKPLLSLPCSKRLEISPSQHLNSQYGSFFAFSAQY